MTKTIRTVTGDISPESFGPTMIHEHLVLDLSRIRRDDDPILSDSEEMDRELEGLKAAGCGGIVEVTNRGMGRDVEALRRLVPRGTTFRLWRQRAITSNRITRGSEGKREEEIVELFVAELTEGIEEPESSGRIIAEIGSSLQRNDRRGKESLPGRRAGHRSGQELRSAPIASWGHWGLSRCRLFDEMDVDPAKISIGHQDLNGDRDEYERLLKQACTSVRHYRQKQLRPERNGCPIYCICWTGVCWAADVVLRHDEDSRI